MHILFDLDGTLLDFKAGERSAFIDTILKFTTYKPNELECKTFSDINERLFNEFASGKMKRIEFQEARFFEIGKELNLKFDISEANKYYINSLKYQANLYSDAKDLLGYLYKKHDLYVVSNGMKLVQMERIKGISNYFKEVYISEEVGYNKPDVNFFNYVLKDIGDLELNNYIIIGDRLDTDILGGINAGIKTLLVNRDNLNIDEIKPDYLVYSLNEIKSIL